MQFTSGGTSTTAASSNHNGTLLVHGSDQGKLAVTELHKGQLLSSWQPHSSAVPVVQVVDFQVQTSFIFLGGQNKLFSFASLRMRLVYGVLEEMEALSTHRSFLSTRGS